MGNKTSTNDAGDGKEMTTSVSFNKLENPVPLPDIQELASECSELRDMVDDLAEAIEDTIFNADPEDSTGDAGDSLHSLPRDIQLKIHRLHKYLEGHSKAVSSRRNNDQIMSLVREFVSIVNGYMNMLMKNIRKMKQVMEEKQLTGRVRSSRPTRKPNDKTPQQVDVIPEQLDVDSMLMQLTETEMHREELERDIMDVLVIWRSFVEVMHGQEEESLDKVETNVKVKEAADSVSRGLAELQTAGKKE